MIENEEEFSTFLFIASTQVLSITQTREIATKRHTAISKVRIESS